MAILVLVPTESELRVIRQLVSDVRLELCGFGPIAAAARTSGLILQHQPHRVILAGIAGSYDGRLTIGDAYQFDSVASYGIGVGTGSSFATAGQMGWHQWPGCDATQAIGDVITLSNQHQPSGQLLTVCASANDEHDVARRVAAFPDAVAEDMEGFAVALACRLSRVPFSIVRGISNKAGNRNHSEWKVETALQSAIRLVQRILDPNEV